uniref:CUB domain-containing protein n=2 Tax=Pectinophora gossypiella TaxID=13191 RepID=A0A1E1WKN1_PECGO
MKVVVCRVILFLLILSYKCLECASVLELGNGESFASDDHMPSLNDNRINATHYRTIKRYRCASELASEDESVQLIYGTKSWRFPKQDVNLTLTYPVSKNSNTNYILTSMEVVLYCDGTQSSGYITEGGMNQDFISMTFTLPGVTQLSYQFWLYGIPKTCIHYNTTLNKNICGPS